MDATSLDVGACGPLAPCLVWGYRRCSWDHSAQINRSPKLERELIRERMLVGVAKAKAEGKYKGRAPTARMKADQVKQLRAAGIGPTEIARQLGISRTSVFRILTAA